MTDAPSTLTDEFKGCLKTISYARAGWDYQLPIAQRQGEASASEKAMARAREIWRDHPDQRDALREAFQQVRPLATLDEITREPLADRAALSKDAER